MTFPAPWEGLHRMGLGKIPGRATAVGTLRFRQRFENRTALDFFNRSHQGLHLSSIGMGTYRGAADDATDRGYAETIAYGWRNGINVIDTAIRYRAMRSERLIGRLLGREIEAGRIQRDEVFVSTKGGLIGVPAGRNPADFISEEIVSKSGIPAAAIWRNMHCILPEFILGQIDASREHLGVECIDAYYVHNPELARHLFHEDQFWRMIAELFETLETQVSQNKIAAYGIATWMGLRRRAGSKPYLDIRRLLSTARAVGGGNHHFRYLMIPLNVGMPFVYNHPDLVPVSSRKYSSAIEYLSDQGLNVFTSASLYEGCLEKLVALARMMNLAGRKDSPNDEQPAGISLPVSENSIVQLFEVLLALRSNGMDIARELCRLADPGLGLYPNALNAVRSVTGVLSALAGMEQMDHIRGNMALAKLPRIEARAAGRFWQNLALPPEGKGCGA